MAVTALSVYPEASSVQGGRLTVGGCDAIELAREFGTPAYVIAEDDLRARARELLAALDAAHGPLSSIVYASKAMPCTAVLQIFREEGLAVDVASAGELHLALRAGFEPECVYVHGNAKSVAELEAALALGEATIVVDNFDEIDRLAGLVAPGAGQKVMVRVTPGVETDTHAAVATGHARSKFGFPLAEAPEAIARLRAIDGLELRGPHLHIGSQLFDFAPYREAIGALAGLGEFDAYDLGGGLAVAYLPEQRVPAPEAWVNAMAAAAHELLGAADAHLTLEPGRALVAAAGVTLYGVEAVKGETVAVDGGMSDNLRPMLYGAPYDADVADRLTSAERPGRDYRLVGKHCESGDVLAEAVRLCDPVEGDVIVTPVTGAYGHALANNYNGVPRPPVILCSQGSARAVVRRETLEDLHGRDA